MDGCMADVAELQRPFRTTAFDVAFV
jgi:hypothetical protein